MFRKVRKINREISDVEAKNILKKCNHGVLGTIGENGYPYVVPVNYIYYKDCVYFHSGKKGHKIDNIIFSDKVSFNVIGYEDIDEEEVSTDYESVTIFGKALIVKEEETLKIMEEIMKQLVPSYPRKNQYVDEHKAATYIIKIEIEYITGKARADKRNR